VFTITNFALNDARQLVANGTFAGTLTSATGVVTEQRAPEPHQPAERAPGRRVH
jgi:hypothetical protein